MIEYANPRPSLVGLVQPGTVLVRGYWQGDIFNGTAFVFSRWCGAIPYVVRGTTDQANSLVLIGAAPQFDTNCRILGYDPTSAHAVLRFELPPPPPVSVAPPPPPPPPPVIVAPPPPPAKEFSRWLGLD